MKQWPAAVLSRGDGGSLFIPIRSNISAKQWRRLDDAPPSIKIEASMAKILNWRDDWTLRIDTLDDDHREIVDLLVEIARRFAEDPETGYPSGDAAAEGDLCGALDHLGAFTRRHFEREEEFMRTIDYPGLADHRSEHALLMAEHTAMVRELRERGANRLGPRELEALKQWVVAHILGADRGFADHYFEICGGDGGAR